ncbi:MAG: GNAT family N-acetyltransferase [Nocardioidaceae bacterium]|nr:GNAT family N-acetyltransferase [Nocardioidaceae bacterium]
MAPTDRRATRRLLLRGWTDADREPFATMNADPVVMEFFPAPLKRAESDAFVDRIEAMFDAHGFGLWVVERRADRAFLGFTGLAPVRDDILPAGAIEVGWRLARSAWGQGYATEAAGEALRVGFGTAGLAEIVSFTAAVNHPSRRVMERLGMRHDPVDDFDHPAVPPGSAIRPHVLYRLRRQDWSADA